MALTLTITSGVVLLGLTLLGAWRGIPRGLLALAGTLVGALLADLWAPVWSAWLNQSLQVENPATLLWAVTSLTFILAVVLVGYGSSLLLPGVKPNATPAWPGRKARPDMLGLGGSALLGLFEGVLVLGFLLRYAYDLLKSEHFNTAIQASPLAHLLHVGLGWAFLAPSLLVVAASAVSLISGLLRRAAARRKLATSIPPTDVPAEPR